MPALFPDSARIEGGVLSVGGVPTTELVRDYGTPLVAYCEQTVRARARALATGAPEARLYYGTKAFPNVAMLRLVASEGLGADVASLGELRFAVAAGISGDRLIAHGNNKSDAELVAAAEAGATVVLDAPDDAERAAEAGVERALVRVTLGVEADTHEAIRTGHHGSKFGLPPDAALEVLGVALERELDVLGLHIHVGSQLAEASAHRETIGLLAGFAARCRAEHAWAPRLVDVGGGFGVRHVEEEPPVELTRFAAGLVEAVHGAWAAWELPAPQVAMEPGRAIVGEAGITLYRVGSVKRVPGATWVAVDGGMSDNPRPQLYGARYTALLANRADEPAGDPVSIAGLHCESGDVLIDDVRLPEPRRGDLVAVPATGAYTLAMASTYNAVPRPAAVLVGDGQVELIRRRETIDDLLALETDR